MKKGAVISGGGKDGALTVGRMSILKNDYDFAIGVSTGALMMILVLIGRYDLLYQLYTEINQDRINEKSIFNPDGSVNIKRFIWYSVISFISYKKSIGESKRLLSYINENIKDEYFDIIKGQKESVSVVYSISHSKPLFISSESPAFSKQDLREFIWASANVPVIMSTLEKNIGGELHQLVDGGVAVGTPLKQAVLAGCKEIDVFMHKPKNIKPSGTQKNYIGIMGKAAKDGLSMSHDKDLEIGLKFARDNNCYVRVFWMEKELYSNPYIFKKKDMQNLYIEGKRLQEKGLCIDIYDYR